MSLNVDNTLDRLTARNLQPLALGVGAYYSALTVAHMFVLVGPPQTLMVAFSAISAGFFFSIWLYRRSHPANPVSSHRSEFLIAAVVMANCLAHLAVTRDPIHTSNVAIALIGGGLLFLSTKWFMAYLSLGLIGWSVLIPLFPRDAPLTHYGFMIGSSIVLSGIAFAIRRKDLGDLESSRLLSREIELRRQGELEKIHLKERLLNSEKMSSLGLVTTGLAHEFSNILAIIRVNSELGAAQETSVDSRDRFNEIAVAVDRASAVTSEMLAFSGKTFPEKEPVNLHEAAHAVATRLSGAIAKLVDLRIPDASCPRVMVDADRSQVEQIATNLINNAADAVGDSSGSVTITTGELDVDGDLQVFVFGGYALRPGRFGFLRVADTGTGITADEVKRIFEPYYSTKFAGRGLGLASVAGILQSHDGGIQVESTPGSGSTFTVLLPLS